MSRRTLINLIFFNAVFALMLFWAVNNIVTLDFIERPYTITGDFAQASGVGPDAEVTYLGVNYGYVGAVERTADGVRIAMKIDRGKDIPAGSIARIFRKSAIGEPYIDFVPPDSYDGGSTERIEPGENVPMERTTVPLEFSELLRSASALISSIDPEAAGGLVHELALALDGRSGDLRTLMTSVDSLTASFVERTDQLERLTANSARLTRVLADRRLSIGQSIENLRDVAQTLRDARGDTQVLLDVGPDFLSTTADLVADQKRNLDCLLTDLAPVLRATASPDSLADLETIIRNGPEGFGYVFTSIDHEADGPWVRVNLLPPQGPDPRVYVPPKSLPAVPTVSPCASEMEPATIAASGSPSGRPASPPAGDTEPPAGAAGSRPAAAPGGGGGSMAVTGAAALLGLALLLLGGGLAAWRARRSPSRP